MGKIKIKCLNCGKTIESTHRHRFKECSCGNIFVEGGDDYLRFGGNIKNRESYLFIKDGKEIKPEDMFIKNKQLVQLKNKRKS
jgi:hypothetical protein